MKKRKFSRPRARKIPLDLIVDFLEEKGYRVIKIERPWRHVIAVVEKSNKRLFFKMATTIKTGKMTKNEVSWNQLVDSELNSKTLFRVPQIKEWGFFQNKLFFFIGDYFGIKILADKNPPRVKQLDKWIVKVAQTAFAISKIKHQPQNKQEKQLISDYLITSAAEWASQISIDVKPLLTIIRNSKQRAERCWLHGDFVPWHMYELDNGCLGLVDAEHGGHGLKYYDVAYFYIRVRQGLEEKELAKFFLEKFMNLLSKKEKFLFWNDLKPILAQKLIGDFWGAETGLKKSCQKEFQKCRELEKDLIKGKII